MSTALRFSLLLATAVAALSACADPTASAGGDRPVALSFAVAPAAGANLFAGSINVEASPLVITRAQLVFKETELETADGACTVVGNDDDCPEIEAGPVLVDLPLDGSTRSVVTAAIPAGTYEEIEMELGVADSDDPENVAAVQAFLAANPTFRGVSVRIEGTFNGEPFVFTSDAEAELEFEFESAFVVGSDGHNITVSVDIATWFRGADGSTIDPRTANRGGANESIVDGNIERSFDAFSDDDRDGRHG